VKNKKDYTDKSVAYLEAATGIYDAKQNLSSNNKVQYKSALEQLINLYKYRKLDDKVKQLEEKLKTL